MVKSDVIRITEEAKKVLWHFKIDNNCRSFSSAIAQAVREANNARE